MNLGMVNERYEGIYKSWLSEEVCTQVKQRGCILHETARTGYIDQGLCSGRHQVFGFLR